MNLCRVMLVDDHAVFRETLGAGLAQSGSIQIAGQAGSSAECMAALQTLEVDVLLLDLSLPGRGGADLVLQVARRYPRVGILILSAHPPDRFVVRLLDEGAAGYLHKSCSLEQVITSIQQVGSGKRVVNPDVEAVRDRGRDGDTHVHPHESLSTREYQVMERLVAGAGVSEIAAEMNLSVKTISTYRKRLLDKLGLASNSEMVSYAIQNGLLDV